MTEPPNRVPVERLLRYYPPRPQPNVHVHVEYPPQHSGLVWLIIGLAQAVFYLGALLVLGVVALVRLCRRVVRANRRRT